MFTLKFDIEFAPANALSDFIMRILCDYIFVIFYAFALYIRIKLFGLLRN